MISDERWAEIKITVTTDIDEGPKRRVLENVLDNIHEHYKKHGKIPDANINQGNKNDFRNFR